MSHSTMLIPLAARLLSLCSSETMRRTVARPARTLCIWWTIWKIRFPTVLSFPNDRQSGI